MTILLCSFTFFMLIFLFIIFLTYNKLKNSTNEIYEYLSNDAVNELKITLEQIRKYVPFYLLCLFFWFIIASFVLYNSFSYHKYDSYKKIEYIYNYSTDTLTKTQYTCYSIPFDLDKCITNKEQSKSAYDIFPTN